MSGSIVFAGIAPHPPLLVPEVGGRRIQNVAASQTALREFARRLVLTAPDTIVVISPHSPFDARSFRVRGGPFVTGDFAEFDAPQVALSFENDLELLSALKKSASVLQVPFEELGQNWPLDHGAMVPLYYLQEAGWSGPVLVSGFTTLSREMHLAYGRAISEAARLANKR